MTKKMLSRRDFVKAAALGGGAIVLAACAPAPAAVPATAAPAAAPVAELIELTWMTPDRELENKIKALQLDHFNGLMEAGGKPWRVKGVFGPATDNDLLTKLTLDAAAGTLPDMFSPPGDLLADFAAANYLADLRTYFETWPDWELTHEVAKPYAEIGGKLVGLPYASTTSLFYRHDLLKANGISTDAPKTWDEFYARCAQIADKTDATATGIPGAKPWGGGTWGEAFQMIWLGFDGPIFEDGKWAVHSPNLLKAFEVYHELASNGWLTVDELLSPNPWEPIKYEGFPKGSVAIVTGGDHQWTFDWGAEGATPIEGLFEKVDRWGFPAEDGKPFIFVSGGVGTVVAANSKSPEGCAEFFKIGSDPVQQCKLMEIYIGGVSSRIDMPEKCPTYAAAVNGKMAQATDFLSTGRTFNYDQIGSGKVSDAVGQATEDIITGAKTAKEAMDAFADSLTESLGAENVMRVS